MINLGILLSIAVGGSIGALVRFLISAYLNKIFGATFPVGTLGVNIIGSFLIGFLFLYFENIISVNLKAFLITGVLGALTTFSTFSLETILMVENGLYLKALLNIFLNVTFSLIATILGMVLFKKIYGV